MKKILYVILDGLGDRPCPDLGNKTPLEAAATPNLDKLAEQGQNGLMYPVGKGIAPESDVAVISILGYDAAKYYTGRGPLECYAAGLKVSDGDLAYRVNFATLGKDKAIVDRRVGRNLTTEEASALAQEVNAKVKLTGADFEFKNTIGHRGVLVIRSREGKLSAEVSNTDPAYGRHGPFGVALEKFENSLAVSQPLSGFENSKEAQRAAELTNEFVEKSHQVLDASGVNQKRVGEGKMPGNVILTRDAGDRLPKFPDLNKKYNFRAGCFVEMPVEKGIALLTGMEVLELPLSSKNLAGDYQNRADLVLKALKDFSLLYIHLKGPDEPAHDGNAKKKKESIEAIDQFFFGTLLPSLNLKEVVVAVSADHSTPCALKAHSDDPVPALISGGAIAPDTTKSFSESESQWGKLGVVIGPEFLPLIIKLANL